MALLARAALCDRGVSIKQVACGTSHCAAISDENVLYAWGSNKYGCLGAEIDEEFSPVPRRVRPRHAFTARVQRDHEQEGCMVVGVYSGMTMLGVWRECFHFCSSERASEDVQLRPVARVVTLRR